tara:strand:+ start:168 stop:302 length:135 start_codon:yes stop_codon:yes gene_type:complete
MQKSKEIVMPSGPGTYNRPGRPKTAKKAPAKKKKKKKIIKPMGY